MPTIAERMGELKAEAARQSDTMDQILKQADEENGGQLTDAQDAAYQAADRRFNEIWGTPTGEENKREGGELAALQVEEGRRQDSVRRQAMLQQSSRSTQPAGYIEPTTPGRQSAGQPLVIDREQLQVVQMTRAELLDQQQLDVCCMLRALSAVNFDYGKATQVVSSWGNRRVAEAMQDYLESHQQLGTSPDTAGGHWVPPGYVPALIELLRPASIVRRLGAISAPLVNGSLDLPRLDGGAVAGYTAENDNIGKTQQTAGILNFKFKKLTALVPMSNDLVRYSDPRADQIVRGDLVRAVSQKEDAQFIRGTGSATAPTSIYELVPAGNKFDANATVNLANVTADLGKLELALLNANIPMITPGWMMAPRTYSYLKTLRDGNGNLAFPGVAAGVELFGYPFAFTTQIPINLGTGTDESELYLVDFAQCVIAEDASVGVESSSVAAYHDGAAVQAAFSRDQTVMRIIANQDFNMRHILAGAVLEKVQWAP